MESKYKERAEKILFEERNVSYSKDGECLEHKSLFIEAMCQLAEEVEKDLAKKLDTTLKVNKLYTKQQVEELLQKQRELCAKEVKLDCYLTGPFMNALRFKPLLGEDYEVKLHKDSILNAKLKID
jgi:hypothetical protein